MESICRSIELMQHLAVIMDGNRRWAQARGLLPWQGHQEGLQKVETLLQFCIEKKIAYVSLYAFSIENFKRTAQEVGFLFDLFGQIVTDKLDMLHTYKVQVRIVGDRALLPDKVQKQCVQLEQETADHTGIVCNIMLGYGGQQEIIAACQALQQSQVPVTVESLKSVLWTGNIPDPDLIIRTGNVQRLSNFMLFYAGYSEIRFLPFFWPDVTREILESVFTDFQTAKKNFGV